MTVTKFKQKLNRVFNDNCKTRTWENYVDYAIIGLIILSTLQIFLSTYTAIEERYKSLLDIIDYVTVAAFTIEVSLRIWCADLLDEKYKGFWGRVRYCFTFYGLIDIISTYSFYIGLFIPIPYNVLKVLRVVRLLRLFRYMKAFKVLRLAVTSKRDEMVVSLQFLIIVTLVLSFVLFFVEHDAQPQVYDNGCTSVVWAFVQYIGDPGGFGDTPPITFVGRIIACIIGVLGIAIFAVPAGLIASGFSEVMEKLQKDEEIDNNINKIKDFFLVDCKTFRNENFWPARFERISMLQSKLHLTDTNIVEAVEKDPELRIVNFSVSFPDEAKGDPMAVELVHLNTDYGYCSGQLPSSVLIVAMSAARHPGISYAAYHMSRIGRFNFVSNEFLQHDAPEEENRCRVAGIYDNHLKNYPKLAHYVDDIMRLSSEDTWIIVLSKTVLDKSIMVYPGGAKDDEPFVASPTNTVKDVNRFKAFYDDLVHTFNSATKGDAADVTVGCKKLNSKSTYLTKWLRDHGRNNVFEIDLNTQFLYNKKKSLLLLTQLINRHFETTNKYGINLVPDKSIPVYRGSEFDQIRLSMTARKYFTMRFEPVEVQDGTACELGFAGEISGEFTLEKNGSHENTVAILNREFDDGQRKILIESTSDKKTHFTHSGKAAFTLAGRLKTLLKAGVYKCFVSSYDSDVLLSYEFTHDKMQFKDNEMVDHPFDNSMLCINVEKFDFLNLTEHNGLEVMHTDEILHEGKIVDGHVFINDRSAAKTQEFYVEVSEGGECHLTNYEPKEPKA